MNAPTLAEFRVRPVCVPLDEPHRTASGVLAESPLVLLDVTTDDGVTGHGLVFAYTRAALAPLAQLTHNCAEMLAGDPLAPLDMGAKLAARFRLAGTQGLAGMAHSLIDMASWDALARTHGLGLATLLGGRARPVPAYGGVGFDGVEGSARAAAGWVERGFKGVKAKIGYPSVREDVAVVRAMRAAVGDDVALMVDYNQCLAPADAILRVQALDDEGLAWVEEPVLADDFAGHAAVAAATRTPVQSGENWWGPRDLRHAIDAGAADYMMPDAGKIGGVSGWLRAAALGEANAIRLSSHLYPEISARLLSVTPTAHWLEYVEWWNPVLATPLEIADGSAVPGDEPGSGIEWDERALERFSV